MEEDAVLTCELLESDRDKRSNATYYKDLEELVVKLMMAHSYPNWSGAECFEQESKERQRERETVNSESTTGLKDDESHNKHTSAAQPYI